MPLNQDLKYRIYNDGIEEGKAVINDQFDGEDLVEFAVTNLPKRDADYLLDASPDVVIEVVKAYLDGIEDGVKLELGKQLRFYQKWARDEP